MAYKQPRVPEYRESEGVGRYMRPLILFLKDFASASWKANNQRIREIRAVDARIDALPEIPEMPEIVYPVTSVNGKTGEVSLSPADVGALAAQERAADSACFAGRSWAQALDALHPVGSIYVSVQETSPAALFGGAWEQLEDVFLLAAGSLSEAGAVGGEAEHTLTAEEMPKHVHQWKGHTTFSGSSSYRTPIVGTDTLTMNGVNGMQYAGGSQPHNNMPPYLAAYMWKRVA